MNKNNFLEGKNILITGASSGIGRTLTKNLSKFGANIIMLSKNEKKLDSIYDLSLIHISEPTRPY